MEAKGLPPGWKTHSIQSGPFCLVEHSNDCVISRQENPSGETGDGDEWGDSDEWEYEYYYEDEEEEEEGEQTQEITQKVGAVVETSKSTGEGYIST